MKSLQMIFTLILCLFVLPFQYLSCASTPSGVAMTGKKKAVPTANRSTRRSEFGIEIFIPQGKGPFPVLVSLVYPESYLEIMDNISSSHGLIGVVMERWNQEAWETLARDLPYDPDRVYVCGWSAGGAATIRAISSYPQVFAGAASFFTGLGNDVYGKEMAWVNARHFQFLGNSRGVPFIAVPDSNIGNVDGYYSYIERLIELYDLKGSRVFEKAYLHDKQGMAEALEEILPDLLKMRRESLPLPASWIQVPERGQSPIVRNPRLEDPHFPWGYSARENDGRLELATKNLSSALISSDFLESHGLSNNEIIVNGKLMPLIRADQGEDGKKHYSIDSAWPAALVPKEERSLLWKGGALMELRVNSRGRIAMKLELRLPQTGVDNLRLSLPNFLTLRSARRSEAELSIARVFHAPADRQLWDIRGASGSKAPIVLEVDGLIADTTPDRPLWKAFDCGGGYEYFSYDEAFLWPWLDGVGPPESRKLIISTEQKDDGDQADFARWAPSLVLLRQGQDPILIGQETEGCKSSTEEALIVSDSPAFLYFCQGFSTLSLESGSKLARLLYLPPAADRKSQIKALWFKDAFSRLAPHLPDGFNLLCLDAPAMLSLPAHVIRGDRLLEQELAEKRAQGVSSASLFWDAYGWPPAGYGFLPIWNLHELTERSRKLALATLGGDLGSSVIVLRFAWSLSEAGDGLTDWSGPSRAAEDRLAELIKKGRAHGSW